MATDSLRIFKGAVCVITGGASGIGRALGSELAGRGADVILADLQIGLAQEAAEEIRLKGGGVGGGGGGAAEAADLDVTDFEGFEALLKNTMEEKGRLDFVFNNAGIGIFGPVSKNTLEDWNRVIDVNLRGVVNGVHASYQLMLKQGFGHIVNTASMAGLWPAPGITPYTMSKYGVVGLSKALRAEAVSEGIRVSVICPGLVRTPIMKGGKYGKFLVEIPPSEYERVERWLRPMAPERFATKVIDRVAKNRSIIIVPWWCRLAWWLSRLSPSLAIFISQKVFEDAKKRVGPLKGV